jgi:molecular chaperone GrpE
MGRRVSIPVTVRHPSDPLTGLEEAWTNAQRAATDMQDKELQRQNEVDGASPAATTQSTVKTEGETESEVEKWRERALRSQAEMENFRRRQQQLAQDQISQERQRLLAEFLAVVDNLERALKAPRSDGAGLHEGVQLTHRAALKILEKEGVEPIDAAEQMFDPTWHEAVATVGHNATDVAPNSVVEVVEAGYRLGDQLLRPSKVVVAV